MRLISAVLTILVFSLSVQAQPAFESRSNFAVILDHETGEILWERNGETPFPPASMSKLMTVLMALEAIEAGNLTLDTELPVSEYAWRTGGSASGSSTMFLEVNSRVRVEDLLRGIIVQSGNDACIVIAEALGGTESAFAEMMTDRARELGFESATFANSTGWPHPDHRVSAADLARIASRLISEFPAYYPLWAEREYTYNGIRQFNRNPLLGVFPGADGLKTGHTEESGYGLVGSAERDGVRRIIVFNGMDSNSDRASEAERMMRAALSDFAVYDLFESGDRIDHSAPVFMGESETVALRVDDAVRIGMHRRARRDMTVSIVYDGPVPAPIAAGDEIGRIIIEAPGYETREYPVYADQDVPQKGLMGRIGAALAHMIRGGS